MTPKSKSKETIYSYIGSQRSYKIKPNSLNSSFVNNMNNTPNSNNKVE